MSDTPKFDQFTRAYIECALWSSGEEFDSLSISDLAPETLARMIQDCADFQAGFYDLFTADNYKNSYDPVEHAGHDFWLTRCGHGAGFWDGDWREPVATKLTDAAYTFGAVDLYVGDDLLIYA